MIELGQRRVAGLEIEGLARSRTYGLQEFKFGFIASRRGRCA